MYFGWEGYICFVNREAIFKGGKRLSMPIHLGDYKNVLCSSFQFSSYWLIVFAAYPSVMENFFLF